MGDIQPPQANEANEDAEPVIVPEDFGVDRDPETHDDSYGATTEDDPLYPYEVPAWAAGEDGAD